MGSRNPARAAVRWLRCGIFFFVVEGAQAGGLEPVALRCESRVEPVGIDETQPRLTWRVASADRGQKQTAYRILVASSAAALKQNQGDLWDSGKTASGETVNITYAGKPLTSGQRCCWSVMGWGG